MQSLIARPADPVISASWRIVHDERQWISSPSSYNARHGTGQVLASRWAGSGDHPREVFAETDSSYHVIAIAVRMMNLAVFAADRRVHEGPMAPGTIQLTRPAQSLRAIFRGCYDVLHLHIRNTLIDEIVRETPHQALVSGVFGDPTPFRDPIVEGLAQALIRADACGGPLGPVYADSIGSAITARLVARHSAPSRRRPQRRAAALATWRLKRVIAYVDANLADPIGLTDMAGAAGLSRMHFAAQFRAAMGVRPHEYVLRRRVERAQTLLAGSRLPLCDVALDAGFSSQSQFTTVFGRFVGETPKVWRHRNHGMAPADPHAQHGRP